MIGFPLALTLGWVNSPPYFTAATETIADLANAALETDTKFQQHRLDATSETMPVSAAGQYNSISPILSPTMATAVPED
jgi:hypothetical protein